MVNRITVIPGQCELIQGFLDTADGARLFYGIASKAKWQIQTIKLFNKSYASPRLTAWYGDAGAIYQYSGTKNIPLPWFEEIACIRELVEKFTDKEFNSVLLNQYRDGNDSMGIHSDDEKELGSNPTIASVSLGATRRFIMHPKLSVAENKSKIPDTKGASIKIDLHHGSLLLMTGKCQSQWKHSLPKTRKVVGKRINLTYRLVL